MERCPFFYAGSELIKPSSIENGNIDLNDFLIPYVSQDESEEIYWFEDIGEMKYANSNKNFECEVKIDGEWKLLKYSKKETFIRSLFYLSYLFIII